MSTKTLRKRIALVAVATLGAGVLSVAPAFAASEITTGTANVAGTIGVVTDRTGSANAQTMSITTAGQLTLAVASPGGADGKVTITGGTFTGLTSGGTISASGTSVTQTASAALVGLVAKPTAAGVMVISSFTTVAGTTSSDKLSVTVTAVANVNVFSADKSFFSTEVSGVAAADNVDATYTSASGITLVPATRVINGGIGYFGYFVKDANSNALVANVIGANVTGACVVGAAAAGTFNAASSTTANSWFQVSQSVANTPTTCLLTVSVNGVPVASRSFTLQGEVTKIALDYGPVRLKASTTANASAVYASALDAAGNAIDNVTLAPVTTYYNAGLTNITNLVTKVGSLVTTDNSSDITCTAKGAQKMQFSTTNASSISIKSAVADLFCAGGVVTYSASFDKASYVSGDIATLTITAKDSAGNLTNDYATTGAKVEIAGSNMTAVSAVTSVDTFTNGVAKYKFIVGATEGSYQMSVNMPAYNDPTTPQAAITVAYKISGSGAVSNADVLKAIVSLIASINKQIAALQKALLKK